MVAQSLARPYRVRASMVLLVALVPLYILIPEFFPPRIRHAPELALDRALPLIPAWAVVYGALYLFLILLPVLVVRQDELIRRTVYAYLLMVLTKQHYVLDVIAGGFLALVAYSIYLRSYASELRIRALKVRFCADRVDEPSNGLCCCPSLG